MTLGNGFEIKRGRGEKRNSLFVHLRINTLQVVLDLAHHKFDSPETKSKQFEKCVTYTLRNRLKPSL